MDSCITDLRFKDISNILTLKNRIKMYVKHKIKLFYFIYDCTHATQVFK